jgi:hypothetical protein
MVLPQLPLLLLLLLLLPSVNKHRRLEAATDSHCH